MSLKTRFRNLGNVLVQDEKQTEVFVLESPVISTGMFARMKEHLEGRFYEIDCVFEVRDGEAEGRRVAPRHRAHSRRGGRRGAAGL